eukprot:365554-Chlamydomonas_euryale.AAC.1
MGQQRWSSVKRAYFHRPSGLPKIAGKLLHGAATSMHSTLPSMACLLNISSCVMRNFAVANSVSKRMPPFSVLPFSVASITVREHSKAACGI